MKATLADSVWFQAVVRIWDYPLLPMSGTVGIAYPWPEVDVVEEAYEAVVCLELVLQLV